MSELCLWKLDVAEILASMGVEGCSCCGTVPDRFEEELSLSPKSCRPLSFGDGNDKALSSSTRGMVCRDCLLEDARLGVLVHQD